ncbi:hypothetical protein GYMLUDRAFT_237328 [Collybiopsis luxurians FD-317 M1]|nr:hypothetical protein GYMLUDRAFT_237328 [Collybiopsis luxurians FD-317 M1]
MSLLQAFSGARIQRWLSQRKNYDPPEPSTDVESSSREALVPTYGRTALVRTSEFFLVSGAILWIVCIIILTVLLAFPNEKLVPLILLWIYTLVTAILWLRWGWRTIRVRRRLDYQLFTIATILLIVFWNVTLIFPFFRTLLFKNSLYLGVVIFLSEAMSAIAFGLLTISWSSKGNGGTGSQQSSEMNTIRKINETSISATADSPNNRDLRLSIPTFSRFEMEANTRDAPEGTESSSHTSYISKERYSSSLPDSPRDLSQQHSSFIHSESSLSSPTEANQPIITEENTVSSSNSPEPLGDLLPDPAISVGGPIEIEFPSQSPLEPERSLQPPPVIRTSVDRSETQVEGSSNIYEENRSAQQTRAASIRRITLESNTSYDTLPSYRTRASAPQTPTFFPIPPLRRPLPSLPPFPWESGARVSQQDSTYTALSVDTLPSYRA